MTAIETIGLTKLYGKSRGIVDIDLSIQEGEIFGFIGPNGAGKSTTIRTLLNFIFPTSGSGKIFGYDIVRESRAIRELIGYLPSEIGFYDDMTVKELLAYSAKFYKSPDLNRIPQLAEIFELDLKKKLHTLSLGNKKKVGIVLTLLHQPRLLILDEPTSGLDPLMQQRFFEVITSENKLGVTVFFSSHVLSEVQRLCQRVAFIKEGKILRIENIQNLRQKRFRNVKIAFNHTPPHELNINGIINFQSNHNNVNFFFQGNVNELIRGLFPFDVQNLWIEEPTLEEIFLNYYQEGKN